MAIFYCVSSEIAPIKRNTSLIVTIDNEPDLKSIHCDNYGINKLNVSDFEVFEISRSEFITLAQSTTVISTKIARTYHQIND